MNKTDRPDPDETVPKAKLSHSQELLRMIEEYANEDKLVTDDLRSYGAAARELGLSRRHERGRWRNNRARTRINRPDDGSARCRGSRVRDQPNDFCPSTPPPTTPSTSSVTSSQRRHTGHSEPRPCRRGAR